MIHIRFISIIMILICDLSIAEEMSSELVNLSERWAKIKYHVEQNQRVEALEVLSTDVESLVKSRPGEAPPMVWQAVVLSTIAEEKGGIIGLSMVKRAKRLLEQTELIDPLVLDGSIYTLLGSLYYQVPGYPIGFGNLEKAEEYLLKALEISPDGVDSNYFYGDFLLQNNQYRSAIKAFEKALNAPPRVSRPLADAGRKKDVEVALSMAKKQLQLSDTY